MDNEQLEKRIQWLDDERRKDKIIISDLEDRLLDLEGKLDSLEAADREFDSDITRLRTTVTKVDDFETELSAFRLERKKELKDQEKIVKTWIADAKKMLRTQIQGVETQQKKQIEDIKKIKELDKERFEFGR